MNDQSFIYSWHANTDRLHVYHRWTLYSRERMFSIEIHKDTWNDVEPKGTMIRKKNNCLRKRRRSDCLWQSSDSERWSFFLWFFFFKKGSLYCRKEVALSCFLEAVALWCHVFVAWDLKRKGRRYMAFQTLDVFEEEEKTNRATWWCWWLGYYFFYCISFFFFFLFSLC